MSTTPKQYLELAKAINVSGQEVTFFISSSAGRPPYRYVVPPGGIVELAPGYCQPRASSSPDKPLEPIVVTRTQGRVVPLDSADGQAFLAQQAMVTKPAPQTDAKPEAKPAKADAKASAKADKKDKDPFAV